MELRALGFCGVDDSVHPHQLAIYAHFYPTVEFGILFRPDKEGQPRYPSKQWVVSLVETVQRSQKNSQSPMKLAAHLCGQRVDEVLRGEDSFVQNLSDWGFGRIQVNATAVNGVDTSVFVKQPRKVVEEFLSVTKRHPEIEFILQKNEETRPLWFGVLEHLTVESNFPSNISMLHDESKGTGVLPEVWPMIYPDTPYQIGYAGGIGPSNVAVVLSKIQEAAHSENRVWIDMESSLRSQKNGKDVFDLDKCHQVILEVCQTGFLSHPPFLRYGNLEIK